MTLRVTQGMTLLTLHYCSFKQQCVQYGKLGKKKPWMVSNLTYFLDAAVPFIKYFIRL